MGRADIFQQADMNEVMEREHVAVEKLAATTDRQRGNPSEADDSSKVW